MKYQIESPPIIIVAAGRSGSKMLRSIIGSHPDVTYFPREINYIWRHGNISFPTDELKPKQASVEVIDYVRSRFDQFSRKHNHTRTLEKTCANSLRVEFVHKIVPEAYIIHLVRDGRSVAESARRKWMERPELGYLLEKARWLPPQDIPYYGLRYLRYQFGRGQTESGSQSSWGPRFAGLDQLIKEKSLIEVCGLQWKACVEAAESAFEHLPPSQIFTVRYEDIVRAPMDTMATIFKHIQLEFDQPSQEFVTQFVTIENLEKWRSHLNDQDIEQLLPHIESTLEEFGYPLASI